jgi:hypothetical protein
MYAKVTTYQINPERFEEMNALLSELKGKCSSLPGIMFYNTVWREDGQGVSTTIYDCRASAVEAGAMLQGIWAQFSEILSEEPVTEVYTNTKNMLFK